MTGKRRSPGRGSGHEQVRTPRSPIVAAPLADPQVRRELGERAGHDDRVPVVIELHLINGMTLDDIRRQATAVITSVVGEERAPTPLASAYLTALLTDDEMARVAAADASDDTGPGRTIHRIWPDFTVHPLLDRSVATVKADAALRAFAAGGQGITWAVVDSGIDGSHPHFATHGTLTGCSAGLHKDFSQMVTPGRPEAPLTDTLGHGTHVAGIIAGQLDPARLDEALLYQHDQAAGSGGLVRRALDGPGLSGVAPTAQLVSLKVFDDTGMSSTSAVIAALHHIRTEVNADGRNPQVHGVNLSLGYAYDQRWSACGQSPLCQEVHRLVRSGVVAVAAAGNHGYGQVQTEEGMVALGLSLSITDPGNAQSAITVGATHRRDPHTYGVSWFSSKGPTADGRLKPDLVAPGERVTSCAAGASLAAVVASAGKPLDGCPVYIDDSGTSMAAPHVSGAVAAFLSVRPEFIGQPEELKRIFCESAVSLNRDRAFQGAGLLDVMRALELV